MAKPLDLADLQVYLSARIAPARALGLSVEAADPVIIAAPLEPNLNDKGTAFAGSLFSVAALAGWMHVMRWCSLRSLDVEVALQGASVQFVAPARGAFRASAGEPSVAQRDKLELLLARRGRGRIELPVEVNCEAKQVMKLTGVYAVTLSAIAKGSWPAAATAAGDAGGAPLG
jgi:thioesterase domain-containing protein